LPPTNYSSHIPHHLPPLPLLSLPLSTSIFCNLIELKQMKSNIPLHIGHSQLCVADIVQKLGYRVQGTGHREKGTGLQGRWVSVVVPGSRV
jgi:hypothetical protein